MLTQKKKTETNSVTKPVRNIKHIVSCWVKYMLSKAIFYIKNRPIPPFQIFQEPLVLSVNP